MSGPNQLVALIVNQVIPDARAAAREVAALDPTARREIVDALLAEANGRRWLRGWLLPRLDPAEAGELARRLLGFADDLAQSRRDRTTGAIVDALSTEDLVEAAPILAGSNAASRLWERLAQAAPERLEAVAQAVMQDGNAPAREATLYLLLIDPYSPARVGGSARRRLLALALADPDPELRGLAAELVADEEPGRLKADLDRWLRDPGLRVRTVAWEIAFDDDLEAAAERAVALLTDEAQPLELRRSALHALGGVLPTRRVAPILSLMVVHPDPVLAKDAANLLWALHRTPLIADAAARSPHAEVRAVAERLLHPEHGSPAAGGARPGSPTDVYGQLERVLREEPGDAGQEDRE